MTKKKKRIFRSVVSFLLAFAMVFTAVIPAYAVGVGGNEPVHEGGDGMNSFRENSGAYSSYDPDDGVQAFVVDDAYGFKVRNTNSTVVTPFGTQDRKGGEACRKKYSESGDSMDMSNYYIFDASKNSPCMILRPEEMMETISGCSTHLRCQTSTFSVWKKLIKFIFQY